MQRSNPDIQYQKSRAEMIIYEDNSTSNLLSGIPNYYLSVNDQTRFGELIHAVGKELARLEYAYTSDLWAKSPRFLTPSDSRRRYQATLSIPREYPLPSQSDLDYLSMVVSLIQAFGGGTTKQSIEDVITAYVGDKVEVIELFKRIGNSIYDQSDRNTISVSAKVGSGGDLLDIAGVKTLTENLYSALDLAKPAHVGIALNAVFGADEEISEFITGRYGIEDHLTISILLHEEVPEDPLWQSPRLTASTPDTRIGPTALNFTTGQTTLSGLQPREEGSWSSPLNEGDVIKVGYQDNSNENGYYHAHIGKWVKFTATQGKVSPILDQVWEVTDSDPIIMDLD
jgi:hypothetical protein